jgi:hypothetical protein
LFLFTRTRVVYCAGQGLALQLAGMPALTRRRSKDPREECWHVYYGDVRVGTIAIRSGNPADTDPWACSCGFYPGNHPRECTSGTAASFDEARLAFESAWRVFLAKRTEADFQAWRDHRDWIARRYAMWERGEKLPSQVPSSLKRCVCGASFDSHATEESYPHRAHIYAAQAADGIRR